MDRQTLFLRMGLTHGAVGAIVSLPVLGFTLVLSHIPGSCDQLWPTLLGSWAIATAAATTLPGLLVSSLPDRAQRARFRGPAAMLGAVLTVVVGHVGLSMIHTGLTAGPAAAPSGVGLPAELAWSLALAGIAAMGSLLPWGAAEWSLRDTASAGRHGDRPDLPSPAIVGP